MIETRITPDPATMARRLADKAEALARARAEERLRKARADPWRWRKAGLLWPLF
jgi:hypothetical protein